MSEFSESNRDIASIRDQFKVQLIDDFFEVDDHIDIQNCPIDRIHILHGPAQEDDIVVVIYHSIPYVSFYDSQGALIDVDHYLPDAYPSKDKDHIESVIYNLRDLDLHKAKSAEHLTRFLRNLQGSSGDAFANSIQQQYGLRLNASVADHFFSRHHIDTGEHFIDSCMTQFKSFHELLAALIASINQQSNRYIHITPDDNIIITPLNKRSGIAVMIETQTVDHILLPPNKWTITRTEEEHDLERALAFRSDDIRQFFASDGYDIYHKTDRYHLSIGQDSLVLDSLLDNTKNVLEVPVRHQCFHFLPSDQDILVVLSHDHEVTIINTHGSIVPRKWPKKIVLDETIDWVRADDNMYVLFVQTPIGEIIAYDITGAHPQEIRRMGVFEHRFEIDQSGQLIVRDRQDQKLKKISTNISEIEIPGVQQSMTLILKNLAHLFQGESLFTQHRFAQITEVDTSEKSQAAAIPSYIESAKFDFETNVEHLIVSTDDSYEALLDVQQKVAIARQNLIDELSLEAEKAGTQLVGQRLQKTVNTIVQSAELRVRALVEESRAASILAKTREHYQSIDQLSDPDAYRLIINELRGYQEELMSMKSARVAETISEFKTIQSSLNASFSEQISQDNSVLNEFIIAEINSVEAAIQTTHDLKQLQSLLSVHPAALELMSLLKQPFILQHIAKEQQLSPSGIQSRLYQAIEDRSKLLQAEIQRQAAERQAAKLQFVDMIRESIEFFISHHTGGFADVELQSNAAYQQIQTDVFRIEEFYQDVRTASDLRRQLERRILERSRADLEKVVTYEGTYAFVQNDPDLYIDTDSNVRTYPHWTLELVQRTTVETGYYVSYIRSSDREVHRPSIKDNLESGESFDILNTEFAEFMTAYRMYTDERFSYHFIESLWSIHLGESTVTSVPQYKASTIESGLPQDAIGRKALRCALEKRRLDHLEKTRERKVPVVSPEFIDETPYFQMKLQEFFIKAKLQLVSGSGVLLLSGPPSTGKSAFLKFAAALMNREYFEHTADKWQTKNSLTTAIKFGEYGPYSTPAGFTQAITTPYSMLNIEEIKEWPEALRKSLNPFFAGSQVFITPDGTEYQIGDNLLLCAAANMGSIYRRDDEPFTADFWSRIEVMEYNYGPESVEAAYMTELIKPSVKKHLTMQELIKAYFNLAMAPDDLYEKSIYICRQVLRFLILPKADEQIKRKNLDAIITSYFDTAASAKEQSLQYSPEEAAKVALRRVKDFQQLKAVEFFDMYHHFVNGEAPAFDKLSRLQTEDVERYNQYKILMLCLRHIEGCLRRIREQFHSSAGGLEIEGTNREFIKSVHLLGMMGKL